jgi:predicted secreted protein
MRLPAIRWMMGHMAQGTQTPASTGKQAQPTPVAGRRKRVARTIMLAWVVRRPWERRFQQRVIVLAIALGAVRGLAQQGQTRASEWDKRSRARALEAEAKKAMRRGKQAISG